ncbi:lysophosphatidic acid receptor 6 [Amia ocellicauda]|uniref:lysophosphatidic acid receptor 6 n=1 Tax=Amia ocellicauda TaxID=2972642 RepID=UPI003464BD3A|nr:GPR17 protein [Amia calva]
MTTPVSYFVQTAPYELSLSRISLNFTDYEFQNSTQEIPSYQCISSSSFQFVLLPIIYSVVFVLSFLGNGVALGYLLKKWQRSPQAKIFILNLIILDLLFTLCLPFQITYHVLGNTWIFGEIMCKISSCLFFGNIYSCTLFLTCICVDRYIAVVHPIRYLKLQRPLYRILVSAAIWLLFLFVLFFVFSKRMTNTFSDGRTACMENFSSKSWSGRLVTINLLTSIVGFFIPFSVTLTCYALITKRILLMAQGKQSAQHLKKKALGTILLVICVLTLSFLPFHVIQVLHSLARGGVLHSFVLLHFTCGARRVMMGVASLNSCLDPLVYYFSAEDIRVELPCFCKKGIKTSSESTSNNIV